MGFFLILVSMVYVAEGVVMILSPKTLVKFVNALLRKKEPRVYGIVPLIVGILLLLAVSSSHLNWLIALLGLAAIAKGVYIFLTPLAKIKAHWWFTLSDNGHRGLGILVLVLGVLIFISTK